MEAPKAVEAVHTHRVSISHTPKSYMIHRPETSRQLGGEGEIMGCIRRSVTESLTRTASKSGWQPRVYRSGGLFSAQCNSRRNNRSNCRWSEDLYLIYLILNGNVPCLKSGQLLSGMVYRLNPAGFNILTFNTNAPFLSSRSWDFSIMINPTY